MNVYVAGSTKDIERVRNVQKACHDVGWDITFDWTGDGGEINDKWTGTDRVEAGAAIAMKEVIACQMAHLTIVLAPPRVGVAVDAVGPMTSGLGCWIELGMTLASGGRVWVAEPHRDSVFWCHHKIRIFRTYDLLLEAIDTLDGLR